MKITVCELPNTWSRTDSCWQDLIHHLTSEKSEILLLPEMPFYEWITRSETIDPEKWHAAVKAHEKWINRFTDLPVSMVISSRPIIQNGSRLNQGFIWTRENGVIPCHEKYYLPDEPGYFEASWYSRGSGDFRVVCVNGLKIGFLICTELWFTTRAREYLAQGIDLLVCPRATPESEHDIWVTGGKAAAIVSGAWCLSSNYNGPNTAVEDFGGTGWIIEPERGNIMGLTSPDKWFLTLDIDPAAAQAAKKTYPRYVKG